MDGKYFGKKLQCNKNTKIHGENLIVLLSNKIISINSSDGNINWNYTYKNNKPLQALEDIIVGIIFYFYFTKQ